VLAMMQAVLCACAIVGDRLGTDVLVTLALAAVTIGVLAIAVLDTARWRPMGIAVDTASGAARGAVGLTAVDRQ
jgi:hypothetical protein